MFPVSEKFRTASRQNHTVVARAELWRRDRLIRDDIPIVSGTLTDDSTALIRRQIKLELPAVPEVMSLLPAEHPGDGGLWPLGNELKIFTGIDFEDGTDAEWVPQGSYRVSKPRLDDSGDDVIISVTGLDRGRVIQRARFVKPYNIKAGTNYVTAIRDLILSRMPSLTEDDFDFMETSFTTPVLNYTNQDDPWDVAVKMAASIGAELFWDGRTKLVLRPEPDPWKDDSAFDYVEGEDCTMTGISREMDEDQTYNACVVTGETSSNNILVQGVAYDLDETSPTWYDPQYPEASIFGFAPEFITSKYVTNRDQATAAAQANLRKKLGLLEDVTISAWAMQAHESNDIIAVQRERLNINNLYVLEAFNMGLGENVDMTGNTRRRRAI